MPVDRTIRGRVAVAGVGETPYYKHGQSPDAQFKLTLMAILAAAEDAGLDPREIDGFATYANDANDAGRLATALGCRELRYANMVFGGGGGGGSGAVGNAAAAIHAGLADCVVVYRGLAQGQGVRFGQAGGYPTQIAGEPATWIPYGVMSPAQMFAMRTTRLMHEHGIERSALRAIALASYHHAQQNPRAVMRPSRVSTPASPTTSGAKRSLASNQRASAALASSMPARICSSVLRACRVQAQTASRRMQNSVRIA